MSLIIDGYNLLHAAGIIGRGVGPGGLERSRQALLNFLAESVAPDDIPRTTVVFDARQAPHGLSRKTVHRGLTVHFASKYPDADSLIEELILKDSAPKRLTVVSSDHRLHRAARRRKATPIDSDEWFQRLLRERQERLTTRPAEVKPTGPLTAAEVAFWLNEFAGAGEISADDEVGEVAHRQEQPPLDDPFPPGYADDLLEEE